MFKIFFLTLSLTLFLYGSSKQPLEHIDLQLHWKYQFEYAGFIAAKEKGFYKDVGLDVALLEYENGEDIIQKVLQKEGVYGIYNSSTLIEYLKGKPLVLVASFFKRSALVLVTQPSIKTPKDLKHKKVMGSTLKDLELNFMPYFQGYDLKLKDIVLVPHTYNLNDFIDKKVDAMMAFRSDQVYKLDALGVKYNVLDPSDENLYVLQEELFTSKKETRNHPLRVAKFRDASIRRWEYALRHAKELAQIIHNKYAPNISVENLLAEAQGIKKLIMPYAYEIGSIDMSFLNKQMHYFKDYYHIDSTRRVDEFVFQAQQHYPLMLSLKQREYVQ